MSARTLRRRIVTCAALACAFAWHSTALGLTVIPPPEHDWTVEVRDWRIGLEQTDWGWKRTTMVYWGGGRFETELLAPTIVALAAGAVATVIAVAGVVFAVFARRSNRRDPEKES